MTPRSTPWKAFLVFLGPLMLSNILQSLSGTINNVYLGQMIGVRALAAVSAFFPILFFFISFILGLGTGASVLIGQAHGARDLGKVKAIAGTALAVALVGGLAVSLFGGAFTRTLLAMLGTPADILLDATAYAHVVLLSIPGLFAFLLVTAMMRGVGDTVTPLLSLVVFTAVGLLVTPALIRGWAGLPALGVTSGAWASLGSLLVTLAWLAVHLRRRGHPLAPDATLLRALWVDWKLLRAVLRIGVPSGVQIVVVALAEVAVLSLVNGFGSDATAAYGVVTQVLSYVQFPAMSIAITASILGAQAIGAGHADRLGDITRAGLVLNLLITTSLVVLTLLCSRAIIGLFITSPSVIELAQGLLHIVLWSSILLGMAGVLGGVMRASGTVLAPTAISISCILAVELPVAYLLSRRIGIDGVWIAYPVTFGAILALQAIYYRQVWRKRAIHRMV
ncbi:multidrug transporter MatE [Sorangium cellulosum]|uniref:Multidrug transporter MatE n=1 Tax=Sorangium cellulosum TaxID=56 RepID=A0A2L0F915_SORCE|nr:MATE family efflux transporter [Sorangium cellulosum]AUX48007.1 multidrug transporter MatE [Sorangium cellulosum]